MSSEISDLLDRVDLVALVEALAGPGRRSGDRVTFQCPHPDHHDRTPSFTVYRDRSGRQRYKCWSQCGCGGDALDLFVWVYKITKAEAFERMRREAGVLDRPAPPRPTKPPAQRPTMIVDTEKRTVPDAVSDRLLGDHLEQRGWPTEVASRFGLTVVVDRWGRPRIKYPYMGWTGDRWATVSWQSRATNAEQKPKWLTPPGAVLPPFGMQAFDTDSPVTGLVICEGPADAITATLALDTVEGAVAIGIAGTNGWRSEWASLLAEVETVVIAADPDEAGQNLVRAVVADMRRPAVVLDLQAGDLTETAKARGLSAVTELLVTALALTGHHDTPSGDGGVQAVGPTAPGSDDLAPLWVRYLDLEQTGPHRWRCCEQCGREALTTVGKRCLLTPGCEGRYVEIERQGVAV